MCLRLRNVFKEQVCIVWVRVHVRVHAWVWVNLLQSQCYFVYIRDVLIKSDHINSVNNTGLGELMFDQLHYSVLYLQSI